MHQVEEFDTETVVGAAPRVQTLCRVLLRIASPRSWAQLLAASAVGLSTSAPAWETDVHYGMTWWLAIKVGFSEQQAKWIASGDQGVDDSNVTGPVVSTTISSCIATDAAGSATVARNHFPSRVMPPADAASRIVTKGEPWWETRRAVPPIVDGTEPTLLALGRYLHSLQDSWSHQGKPDVPLSCDGRYAWGHALARGGWSCHLADLTYKWVEPDVMPMAKATYDALLTAYGKKPKFRWDQVAGQVREFALLDNKFQKAGWLEQRGVTNARDVAYSTSLKNCPDGQSGCNFDYAVEEAMKHWDRRVSKLPPISPQLPSELRALLVTFGQALTAGDEKLLRSLVDQELARLAMERALRINSSCARLYEEQFKWSLLEAFLAARGAHQPVALCELAMQIQSNEKGGLDCSAATAAAIKAYGEGRPRGPDLRKLGIRNPFAFSHVRRAQDGEKDVEYWADGYFPHLSKDRLLLGLAKRGQTYKVTTFIWQPDE